MLPKLADMPPPTDHEVLSKLTCVRCPLSFGRRAAGGTAEYVVCDLADATSVRVAVDRAVNRYGRLDIVFNNGATIQQPSEPPPGRALLSTTRPSGA
ncbi:hypothetical protein GCM10010317_050440 [Streptomyces mirabilis]|nr:hypothetical protein GCM10010317_050440 [Streptomyces mirabilis]